MQERWDLSHNSWDGMTHRAAGCPDIDDDDDDDGDDTINRMEVAWYINNSLGYIICTQYVGQGSGV